MAYYFMKDNFNIINEYEIPNFNDKVFKVFEKYHNDKFNLGFADRSIVILSEFFDMDCVVSFDKNFKLLNEIKLYPFN